MKLLIFLRQLLAWNFYRNPHTKYNGQIKIVLVDLRQLPDFNVGMAQIMIKSVNRTTGEITLDWL